MDKRIAQKEALEEAKRRGLYMPTEDINSNLQKAISAASFMAVEQNGLAPMLDVVMRLDKGGTRHVGALFGGIDFNDKKEKLKAMLEAGKKMGQELAGDMLPLQVTLVSEAWQRHNPDDMDDKQEIIMAATRSWDGREGIISRRTIRDLKDNITDTCPSMEELAEDEQAKEPNVLLSTFFLGFAIGASASIKGDDELREEGRAMEKRLNALFS